MRIVEISYLSRKNLGNFEHDEAVIKAVVEEQDELESALSNVKSYVYGWLSGGAKTIKVATTQTRKVDSQPQTETKKEEPVEQKVEEVKAEEPKKRGRKAKAEKEAVEAAPVTKEAAAPSNEPLTLQNVKDANPFSRKKEGKLQLKF